MCVYVHWLRPKFELAMLVRNQWATAFAYFSAAKFIFQFKEVCQNLAKWVNENRKRATMTMSKRIKYSQIVKQMLTCQVHFCFCFAFFLIQYIPKIIENKSYHHFVTCHYNKLRCVYGPYTLKCNCNSLGWTS